VEVFIQLADTNSQDPSFEARQKFRPKPDKFPATVYANLKLHARRPTFSSQ
jgi:hypothetical protein